MKRLMLKVISITATVITLTACQTTPITSTQTDDKLAVLLAQVDNLDAKPTTKENRAKLFKLNNHCLVEFTGLHDSGTVTEYWSFQNNRLQSAYTTTQSSNTDLMIQRRDFNIRDADVLQNFNALLKHFDQDKLSQCRF